ncbi:MAG: hypothetical protein ACTIJY_09665 [Luteimonas sp.]
MSLPSYNLVVLAGMTRAVHADQPDADWRELEPVLRAQWEQIPRAMGRDAARGLPDAAPAIGPASIDTGSADS